MRADKSGLFYSKRRSSKVFGFVYQRVPLCDGKIHIVYVQDTICVVLSVGAKSGEETPDLELTTVMGTVTE